MVRGAISTQKKKRPCEQMPHQHARKDSRETGHEQASPTESVAIKEPERKYLCTYMSVATRNEEQAQRTIENAKLPNAPSSAAAVADVGAAVSKDEPKNSLTAVGDAVSELVPTGDGGVSELPVIIAVRRWGRRGGGLSEYGQVEVHSIRRN